MHTLIINCTNHLLVYFGIPPCNLTVYIYIMQELFNVDVCLVVQNINDDDKKRH